MKLDELITALQRLRADEGNIEVVVESTGFFGEPTLTTVEDVHVVPWKHGANVPVALLDWRC
jgi:hypothetical protein